MYFLEEGIQTSEYICVQCTVGSYLKFSTLVILFLPLLYNNNNLYKRIFKLKIGKMHDLIFEWTVLCFAFNLHP